LNSILVLVNGSRSSAAGVRAQSLFSRLPPRYDVRFSYRSDRHKAQSILRMMFAVFKARPRLVYVVDCKFSGALAAILGKTFCGIPYVMDTGDACYELAKATRGPVGQLLVHLLEALSYRVSAALVVRGRFHKTLLSQRLTQPIKHIPDGVDTAAFATTRRALDSNSADARPFVIGLLGSVNWSVHANYCYGIELIDALALVDDENVTGMVIGDGTGLGRLKQRAQGKGVAHRIAFVGQAPYEDLPGYLQAMDVCLLPQSDDAIGWVRTTGKLPLYLACNRYILASDVGEASWVLRELDATMLHHPYSLGSQEYAREIASRIRSLVLTPSALQLARRGHMLAQQHFDYTLLSQRLCDFLDEVISGTTDA